MKTYNLKLVIEILDHPHGTAYYAQDLEKNGIESTTGGYRIYGINNVTLGPNRVHSKKMSIRDLPVENVAICIKPFTAKETTTRLDIYLKNLEKKIRQLQKTIKHQKNVIDSFTGNSEN